MRILNALKLYNVVLDINRQRYWCENTNVNSAFCCQCVCRISVKKRTSQGYTSVSRAIRTTL